MTDLNRKYAWNSIKSAIRSYAKDPTPQHAAKVEEAWKEIRRIEAETHWREWRHWREQRERREWRDLGAMRLDAGKLDRTT